MGFRINRGIFQFKDAATETYINKFKIDDRDGALVEVDADGNAVTGYLKVGEKATDSDKVDGYHATNAAGGIPVLNSNGYWNSPNWINVYGHGLYSSSMNGAHFYPNNKTYGSWKILGTKGGWYGLHFGEGTGVTLMMNESESGIHREGSGWKFRHQGGKFYIHTGTNGGGTGYEAWHKGNLTPISYETSAFFVGGDPRTYYPVLLNKSSRTTGRFVIYRDNVHQDESGRGAGRLVLTGYTSGWGHVPLTLHYETKISGTVLWKFLASNYRTGLMVVYLKGGTTYYYKSEHGFTLDDANGQGEPKSDGRTTWLPTPETEANAAWEGEAPSVLTIEHGSNYYDGQVMAGSFKGDGSNVTNVNAQTLDGIDSASFLRSDAADTMGGNLTLKYNTSNASDYNGLTFAPYDDAAGINDYIIKVESSRGVFGRKSFGWHVHTNSAFGVYSNGWEKLFGVEGGTGNSFAKGTFTANNISTNQVFMQSITSDGTIANDKGSYLHLGGWGVSRTHTSAVLVNTAYRADYATSLFDMNISRFTNNSGYITQSSIDTFAEEVRGEIQTAQTTADNAATAAATAQTTADGKLGATAKAADSSALDGLGWGSAGKNVRATEFYADNWFRNYNSNEGLYNQATGQHWYSDDDDYWNIAGGTAANGIRFRDEHAGTIRGYVYANSSNQVGFLDAGGSWAVRHFNDHGTYFYTDDSVEEFKVGRDAVTGNYGTVQTSTTRGGWGGYSINGQYVFMSDHSSAAGIFNDIDNEWMAIFRRNAEVELMYNGAMKLETTSTGISVSGNVNATAFIGDGSALTNLPIPSPNTPAIIFGLEPTEITSVEVTDRGELRYNLANGQALYLDGVRTSIR